MAEVVNLRRARKARARRTEEAAAAANRLTFGRSRAERNLAATMQADAARRLDLHQLHSGPDEDSTSP